MKTIFTLIVAFLFSSVSAQNFLTKGQVYDFNVGDVFQAKLSFSSSPPTYFTKKVLAKTFSSNNDTITYSIEEESYTLAACPTCNPIYSGVVVNSVVITNLADSIINASTSSLQASIDSTISIVDTEGVDACNNRFRNRLQILGPIITISPFTLLGETYIKGCGGPYTSYYSQNGGQNFTSDLQLSYFKKGIDSCGTYFNIPAGLNTLGINHINLKLFPNPSNAILKIETSTLLEGYIIFNTEGKIILSSKLSGNEINIKSLPNGIYNLKVFDTKSNSVSKIFVKE
jgi:hypothetical protein